MRYDPQPGIVYDVIGYSTMFFNQRAMRSRQQTRTGGQGEADDLFAWYDRFRMGKRRLDPPETLYPFFCYDAKAASFVSFTPLFQFFWEHYDFQRCDTPAFLDALTGEAFRRFCLSFYLDGHAGKPDLEAVLRGEPDSCMRAMALLSAQGEKLPAFVDLFLHFDRLAAQLRAYMTDCCERMAAFHRKYVPPLLDGLCTAYQTNEAAIRRMLNAAAAGPPETQRFTVHLIEHLVLLCKPLGGQAGDLLFFGANSGTTIRRWGDFGNASILAFGKAFGNEVKYNVIQTLCHGACTVSQLARALYVSRSTMDRCLHDLADSRIVRVSKRVGAETYYALDRDYFFVIREVVNRVLDEIWASLLD